MYTKNALQNDKALMYIAHIHAMQNETKHCLPCFISCCIKELKTNDEMMAESQTLLCLYAWTLHKLVHQEVITTDVWNHSSPVIASVYSKVVWECSWVHKSKNHHSFLTTSMPLKTLTHVAQSCPIVSDLKAKDWCTSVYNSFWAVLEICTNKYCVLDTVKHI